jgi:glycosyltransferase involved in cell wall biosynthesis
MKISLVVCTYNYAHFLKDALRTLAAQTVQDFELLIVDDGSTDNTEQVVKESPHSFRNLTYLKKPHSGLPDTRNYGVRAASGTHVGFLDADDLWAPQYLEKVRRVFERNPQAELVCSDGYRVHDSGEVFGLLFPEGSPPVCGRLNSARELFAFFPYVLPSAMIFTKDAYQRVGAFSTRYPLGSDDWEWVIRAVNVGAFCVRLEEKLVLYRTHGGNLTSHADGNFEEWLSMYKDLWKQPDPETEVQARRMTRRHFWFLLPLYPPEKNRRLLDEAIQVHGGDRLLEAARLLTYLGLCTLAKLARLVKRKTRSLLRPRMMDLSSPPEKLFEDW